MKAINPFEISKEKTIERGNGTSALELFFAEVTNKFHVVFNGKTMGTYKTKIHAVKLANKLIHKHGLS